MSHIRFEVTPEESNLPTAFIYVNDDCTGDVYSIEIQEGHEEAETEFWTILGDGWDNKGASVMVPSEYTLTLWQHPDKTGLDEVFNGDDTCQKMSGNLVRQMSHIRLEPTPEESHSSLHTAYIFTNGDCTGDSISIDLEDGQQVSEIEFGTLWTWGWDNKGSSVMVPDGFHLTLWQHPDYTGQSEVFYGQDTCQKMSGSLDRQMSHIKFEPTLEIIEQPVGSATPVESQDPIAYIYDNDDCTGDSLAIEIEAGHSSASMDFWTLLWHTWNDRGRSVKVPNGYTLTLWQHDKSGLEEKFNGQDTFVCQ